MSSKRQLLLLSNSTLHNSEFLQYAGGEITGFLTENNVSKVLFIPFALQNHDYYLEKARKSLLQMGYETEGIHQCECPITAVNNAQAIFIGGGNTFRLLKSLYDNNLIQPIRKRVLEQGVPYIGSSAGTNVATVSINTTNDMPIVYPPSFSALGLVPFNINPHYIDPDPTSTHMGETREERIQQYFEVQQTYPVLGLREGSLLYVDGNKITLRGNHKARLFQPGKEPVEYESGSDLSFLLK